MYIIKYMAALLLILISPTLSFAAEPTPRILKPVDQEGSLISKLEENQPFLVRWSLTHKWLKSNGRKIYASHIVDRREVKTYRLCRTGTNTAGTGTSELEVHIDGIRLNETGNYSLDIGSCLITKARKISLVYRGKSVSVTDFLEGVVQEIDEKTFNNFRVEQISRWVMAWENSVVGQHNITIVNKVEGAYVFCINGSEIGPPIVNGIPNSILLRLRVDSQLVKIGNENVSYRQGNCTIVDGSEIIVELDSRSTDINFYKVTGTLHRQTQKINNRE